MLLCPKFPDTGFNQLCKGDNRHNDKISVQGVNSLWGVFPRLGTRETDRWHIKLQLCATCQCPQCPISENAPIAPKWFNSLDTNFTLRAYCPDIYIYCERLQLALSRFTPKHIQQVVCSRIVVVVVVVEAGHLTLPAAYSGTKCQKPAKNWLFKKLVK